MSDGRPHERHPSTSASGASGMAKDLQRAMAAGIGKLPVSDTRKSSLTSTSATAVVVVGETTVALAKGAVEAGKGAVTAAKDGTEAFQRTRRSRPRRCSWSRSLPSRT